MWEICKNTADAAAEFDRTMQFIAATIQAIKDLDAKDGGFKVVSGIQAKVRRAGIGAMLAMGPFNYPVRFRSIHSLQYNSLPTRLTYECLNEYSLMKPTPR